MKVIKYACDPTVCRRPLRHFAESRVPDYLSIPLTRRIDGQSRLGLSNGSTNIKLSKG